MRRRLLCSRKQASELAAYSGPLCCLLVASWALDLPHCPPFAANTTLLPLLHAYTCRHRSAQVYASLAANAVRLAPGVPSVEELLRVAAGEPREVAEGACVRVCS